MLTDYPGIKTLFEAYVQDQLNRDEPVGLYEPVNYIMQLGGKRIRPVTTLIAYQVFRQDIQSALPLAYAFEMFHNFTLAHDDVMDDAELRRGKPTVHIKYGLNSAILSGDAMLIMAYQYIEKSTSDPVLKNSLIRIFSQTALDICAGQQMDMDFETREDVELSEYLLMIKWKTAVLLAACLQCGALLAGASESQGEHLYLFGLNLGLAFQIQDDVLDLYAEASDFGKKTGGDVLQKKKTFLYLKSLELADETSRQLLKAVYLDEQLPDGEKISTVKKMFDAANVRKYAFDLMEELTDNARDHLNALGIEKENLAALEGIAEMLLARTI